MVTYVYWIAVAILTLAALIVIGSMLGSWKAAGMTALAMVLVGTAAYFFYFQQVFVKRYGGVMTVTVPAGQRHIAITWKDDNMWIENYDPVTNTCHFTEYSRGNILQGRGILKQCNPLSRPGPRRSFLPQ